jgi:cell shape-determining protein MreC
MKKFSLTTKVSSRQVSRNKRITQVIYVGGVILLMIFLLPQLLSFLAYLFFTPFISLQSYLRESTATIPSYLRDRDSLITTQNNLQQELELQKASQATVDRLNIENQLLKGLVGSGTTTRIVAGVTGRPTELPYDVLVIDKGSEAGVVKNAPVYSGLDQAIGFVTAVYPTSAVVVLATTPRLTSVVYIYGPNVYAKAEGQGSGSLRIGLPQGVDVKLGNLVVLPSFEGGIYGKISVIDSEPTRPEQFAYVTTGAQLQSLRYVSVGKEPIAKLSFEEAKSVVDKTRVDVLGIDVPEEFLSTPEITQNGTTTATSTTPVL